MTTEERDTPLPVLLAACGQEHALRWWPELTPSQRQCLHQQLAGIDPQQLQRLFRQTEPAATSEQAVRPVPVLRLARTFEDRERDWRARTCGEMALKAGQVVVILVAGGQGTRLGFEGPKGTYPIGPLSGKSLFQIHAEKVLALGRRYGAPLPLYVMTSPENHADTRSFFDEHQWFGLDPDQVVFFTQGTMPAVDCATGRLLLAAKDRLATSPDGHGGVLHALSAGGHLADLARRGIQYLFYYQVDNPLVMVADPTYLGHHIEADAEMSFKVVPKLSPQEKLGVAAGRRPRPDHRVQRAVAQGGRPAGRTAASSCGPVASPFTSLIFPSWNAWRPKGRRSPSTGRSRKCHTWTSTGGWSTRPAQRRQVRELHLRRAAAGPQGTRGRNQTAEGVRAAQERRG